MVGNSGANLLVTFLSSNVDAAILYPISMGGGLVLTVLAGFTFFKEKKTFVDLTGIVIGLMSMILLNI